MLFLSLVQLLMHEMRRQISVTLSVVCGGMLILHMHGVSTPMSQLEPLHFLSLPRTHMLLVESCPLMAQQNRWPALQQWLRLSPAAGTWLSCSSCRSHFKWPPLQTGSFRIGLSTIMRLRLSRERDELHNSHKYAKPLNSTVL